MADETGLFEREEELACLEGLIERACDGAGGVACVEGAAGIGKSTLLARAQGLARDLDADVLAARCVALEREHPFGAARQLLGGSGVYRMDDSGSPSAGEQLFAVLDSMYGELATRAERRPSVVCVDDAQWCDAESLRLLAYLAARIHSMRVLLLVGARPAEGDERELLGTIAGYGVTLSPRPLSADAVRAFVSEQMGRAPEDAFAQACGHLSGGNPFLLAELIRTARGEGIEPVAADSERVRALTPAGVSRAVLVRLAQLPPEAALLAGALAVLGGSAPLRDAVELAGLDAVQADAAVDALVRAHVLAPSATPEFLHPLVQSAIYEDLPLSRRRAAHLAAARLLDGAPGADRDRVAAHLLRVAPSGDEWASERLIDAGMPALASGGCDAAAAYLGRALAEPPPEDRRAGLLAALAQAEAACGRQDAVTHMQGALELVSEPGDRARFGQSLGRLFFLRSEFALAGEAAKQALRELPDESEPLARALLADYLAAATLYPELGRSGDAPGAALLQEVLAGRLPPEPQLCALVAGSMAILGGANERAREAALQAARSGAAEDDETSQGLAGSFAGVALVVIGEYELAETTLLSLADRARQRRRMLALAQYDQVLASLRWREGRLPEAITHARESLRLRDAGWTFISSLAAPTLAFAELERGNVAAAATAVALAEHDHDPRSAPMALARAARGRVALAQREPRRALDELQLAGERAVELYGTEQPDMMPWRPFAALAANALGDQKRAGALAESGVEVTRRVGSPWALGQALRVDGELAGAEGLPTLQEAVSVLASSRAHLEHAHALVALGCCLRRRRAPREAREPLRAGLEIARRCGAVPLAERAHEELLASGARPRKMLHVGRDALTPAELRVATMAGDGMTNREIAEQLIVSTRTVEAHLAHVYAKLDVNSRRSLGAALGDRDNG
jgi:DNA-binding CsgD family transcriptional regulator